MVINGKQAIKTGKLKKDAAIKATFTRLGGMASTVATLETDTRLLEKPNAGLHSSARYRRSSCTSTGDSFIETILLMYLEFVFLI